jgi:hypothetical protein
MSVSVRVRETELRDAKILARIGSGILPSRRPHASRAGSGSGHLRGGCDERITASDIEICCPTPPEEVRGEDLSTKEGAMIPTAEQRIATKIHLGLLPCDEPHCTWAGLGDGRPCDGCDRGIALRDLQIEAEFDLGARLHRFHVSCFLVWSRAADTLRPILAHARAAP